jgi:flagellar biosynthesis protein FliQ
VLNGPAQRSRRLLAVLSPSLLHDSWTSTALYQALHTLLTIHSRIICVTLQVCMSGITMGIRYACSHQQKMTNIFLFKILGIHVSLLYFLIYFLNMFY